MVNNILNVQMIEVLHIYIHIYIIYIVNMFMKGRFVVRNLENSLNFIDFF